MVKFFIKESISKMENASKPKNTNQQLQIDSSG